MKATWYMNLRVATEATSRGPSGTAIFVMAKLLHAVHGIAKRNGITFASAFPQMRTGDRAHPGTVLRVFTDSRDACDAIAQALEANTMLSGYVLMGRVRPVPEGIQRSVSYQRFRITGKGGKDPETRLRRLAAGNKLPYLVLDSAQTRQRFSLRFAHVSANSAPSELCEPDNYGLSVSTRPFSLPDIPDEEAPWKAAARAE